jgi:hypothetical protein
MHRATDERKRAALEGRIVASTEAALVAGDDEALTPSAIVRCVLPVPIGPTSRQL